MRPGEVHIDTALVGRLLREQFPRWADLPIEPVARSGMDNATFRLGTELSVRLPRLRYWAGQVDREQRWLPYLAPHLPLPIPTPVARGEPGGGYPFAWSVYRWLDGDNASLDRIAEPRRAAVELAGFLDALHHVDPAGGPPPQPSNAFRGVSVHDERDSAIVAARIHTAIAALDGFADTDGLTAVYETALAAPAWDRPPVWLHGDTAPGNLLVRDGRLSAVIDFGTMAVGDPAADLIAAWTLFDADTRDVFRAALAVDDATWARGRAWGLTMVLPSPAVLADPAGSASARRRLDDLVADLRR